MAGSMRKAMGMFWLGVLAAVVPARVGSADPDLKTTVSLDSCDCQRGPDGLCRRWLQNDLSWQLYAPEPATTAPSNADLEHAILDAFGSWQALTCPVCAVSGELPALPAGATDVALARPYGEIGCIAAPCDANPLGLNFNYGGINPQPLLASDCWAQGTPADCAGAAANSGQIAFLRTDAHWPLSTLTVSTTFLTTAQDGHILDADILLRNTTLVFCYDKCALTQWDVRSALILELGNAIGIGATVPLGAAPTPLTVNPNDPPTLPTYVAPALASCACLAYRFSTNPGLCLSPDTAASCDAGPQKPLPHAAARWPWLLTLLVVPIVWRRRQRL